jgi:hypothetical protein
LHAAARDASLPRDFSGSNLAKALFPSLKLEGAIFDDARLQSADGSGDYLRGASFQRANLHKCRFVGTDLREANLRDAKTKQIDLTGANLTNAKLSGADLTSAKLVKAFLTNAQLEGANLQGADLRGVRGLCLEVISSARNWQTAIFDARLAQQLGIPQDEQSARHGQSAPMPECIAVDVLTGDVQPTLGDLLWMIAIEDPRFPRSGRCDLRPLARRGFQQVHDYYAIVTRGEPAVWLIPIHAHPPATLKALRLELDKQTKAAGKRFLEAAEALSALFQAGLATVPSSGPSEPTTLADLQALVEQRCKR